MIKYMTLHRERVVVDTKKYWVRIFKDLAELSVGNW